jgi:ligand-binding sensor domain-containing protein
MTLRRLKAKLRFGIAVCLPLLASFDRRTVAAEAPSERSELLEDSWTVGNESRWQMILSLLQTRDDYLWIGTNRGLIRFDGVRFTDFVAVKTAGMSQGRITFVAM